jgi:hypothetical protein
VIASKDTINMIRDVTYVREAGSRLKVTTRTILLAIAVATSGVPVRRLTRLSTADSGLRKYVPQSTRVINMSAEGARVLQTTHG